MNKMKDDQEFNIVFVSLVGQHPCIYDYTSLDYGRKNIQDNAWGAIAKQMTASVQDCKDRWKNLRGCYTRHLKSLAAAKIKKPYYLAEYLHFLRPFTKTRKLRGDISTGHMSSYTPEQEDDEMLNNSDKELDIVKTEPISLRNLDDDYTEEGTAHSPVKIPKFLHNVPDSIIPARTPEFESKISYNIEKANEDPDLAFLTSVLPDMKDMDSDQKRRFKIGILNLAGQILNETRPSHPSVFSSATNP